MANRRVVGNWTGVTTFTMITEPPHMPTVRVRQGDGGALHNTKTISNTQKQLNNRSTDDDKAFDGTAMPTVPDHEDAEVEVSPAVRHERELFSISASSIREGLRAFEKLEPEAHATKANAGNKRARRRNKAPDIAGYVAATLSRKEVQESPDAQKAFQKEWTKLVEAGVWNFASVKE